MEEEKDLAQETAGEFVRTMTRLLPGLLKRLAGVRDFRQPGKVRHKVDVILFFAIFTFVLQKSSRRQANEELTTPIFLENFKVFFPDLESLPHHDTVNRFLSKVELKDLETLQAECIRDFIKGKKFRKYLTGNAYTIAIDGTQKHSYDSLWAEECQERESDGKTKYSCYCLEASLVFHNGITIPLATEFLNFMEGDDATSKQDCETKAFKRLAGKIKGLFPRLNIMLVLDGLYTNGPIISLCERYGWGYMIVLKDGSLKSVWDEFHGLKGLVGNNQKRQNWHDRRQTITWVNGIPYEYTEKDREGKTVRKELTLNLVVCNEEWLEIDKNSTNRITKTSTHAWLSSKPLNHLNVNDLCNLTARFRWGIESGFLVEKRYGYQYEHSFSFDWNAMRAYHLLMKMAHMINVLMEYGNLLRDLFVKKGMRAAIRFIDRVFRNFEIDREQINRLLRENYQVRFP